MEAAGFSPTSDLLDKVMGLYSQQKTEREQEKQAKVQAETEPQPVYKAPLEPGPISEALVPGLVPSEDQPRTLLSSAAPVFVRV